ncbi:class II glutamine amidotransferase [Uliginosibacterium sp. H1]|uniref:class II glutamine amidotransferase n=1 Tax=Uliginosibacterium sp. H1 TaxID=3114757 RepID=UPI002E1964D9|nr:class II glutamine amidotransferase [Uliginosibacterium sp. H1]
MCQLLGMNCNTPTDIVFSFEGFSRRGGLTGEHVDGWGIAFFEDDGCRIFLDYLPSVSSPIADLVRQYPIKSRNVIAHIRKATQGRVSLANTHPFRRELWGRDWIFAHNGNLADLPAMNGNRFTPVGTTDSEWAFCWLMNELSVRFAQMPSHDLLYANLKSLLAELTGRGTFNFLLGSGKLLFAHCATDLHYIVRQAPFTSAHLADADLSVDFAQLTTNEDRVAVIATHPLTDNETWTRMQPGEFALLEGGERVY